MVGVVVFVPLVGASYWIALLIVADKANPPPLAIAMILGFCIVAGILCVGLFLLFAIHSAGEAACNILEKRGLQLRPRERGR